MHRTAAQTGVVIEVIDDTSEGVVDVEDLRRRLDAGGVALVAVAHLPTHNGLINPAAQIGTACRAAGVPFLLDACQSVGQLPLDVTELGCDILAGTGRKWLRGPRGTGFLYVARGCEIQPSLVDLRAIEWPDPELAPDSYAIRRDARRFELWESNIAARLGLGAAVDYALNLGIPSIAVRVQFLAALLRDQLRARPGCSVLDVGEAQSGQSGQSGIVTFAVAGVPAAEVVARVAEQGVSINVASAATARFDRPGVRLEPVVRASPHYYNTEDELARLLAVLPAPRAA